MKVDFENFGESFMRKTALFLALLLGLGSLGHAQETRVAADSQESPPATLDDMRWLVGHWQGEGIGGAPAVENWLPATGPTMVGTFIQQTSEGAIQFTEHMYLMEEEGSLVLRLKHFNADLTGWEDKEGMVSFRLLAIEDCAAYFHALTLRCDGDNGLAVAVTMQRDAATTIQIGDCLASKLARAEARMGKYADAAMEQVKGQDAQLLLMRSTQEAFLAYRGGECGAVHESYGSGSIRTAMYLGCAIRLTDERTHTIWRNWLQFMDSTPPLLPEPGATI
jgi:uncharacterized protein YecT (DUF1311 family)